MKKNVCGWKCEACGALWSGLVELEDGDADGSERERLACLKVRADRDDSALEHAKTHGTVNGFRPVKIIGLHELSATCECSACEAT